MSDLPVRVASFGDDAFSPGYLDIENKTFHRWKGVVLTREQLLSTLYGVPTQRLRVLNPRDVAVTSVEAPVVYLEFDGAFRPGYRDRSIDAFYAWKGVVLSRRELLDTAANGRRPVLQCGVPDRGAPQVIEIDMPAHLKDQVAEPSGGA